jgi:hypothetical protein
MIYDSVLRVLRVRSTPTSVQLQFSTARPNWQTPLNTQYSMPALFLPLLTISSSSVHENNCSRVLPCLENSPSCEGKQHSKVHLVSPKLT